MIFRALQMQVLLWIDVVVAPMPIDSAAARYDVSSSAPLRLMPGALRVIVAEKLL